MPSSVSAVLVLVAFIIPGFIATRVRSLAFPGSEPTEARLVLTAITFSCINYGLLSWLVILAWVHYWYAIPAALAILAVGILFISPALLGLALARFSDSGLGRRLRGKFGIVHQIPKAWDYFFRSGTPCWVVATMKSGKVIAGIYLKSSFASSFPAEEDLYLEKMCKMSADGKIERLDERSIGAMIRMENVEFLELFEVRTKGAESGRPTRCESEKPAERGISGDRKPGLSAD